MKKNVAAGNNRTKYTPLIGPHQCPRYTTDCAKEVLESNFVKRGWKKVHAFDANWNLYWASYQSSRYIFRVDNPNRMGADQIINHFPNSMALSRKDLLINNIKRYRKDLERKGDALAELLPPDTKVGIGGTLYVHLDIIPETFVLPFDYKLFESAFHKDPGSTWIVKPPGKSQGEGIFLIKTLAKVKRFAQAARLCYPLYNHRETCVVSKYIDNPLLVCDKKFDLRLYVLVTTFNPLKAYLYNEGFCRFCTQRYDSGDIKNLYRHLTNVSIQRRNVEYNSVHGGKWSMKNLFLHLDCTRGAEVSAKLFGRIKDTIRHSLDAVTPVICNDVHCFEVYGYDIIIDNDLKPWLIEINTSPSMYATTKNDCAMKTRLIDNVLDVIVPHSGIPDSRWPKTPTKDVLKNFTPLTPIVLPPKEASASPSPSQTPTPSPADHELLKKQKNQSKQRHHR